MGRIVYSENIGFDMFDWQSESIVCVAAGSDCVLALTADGRVLTKSFLLGREEKKPSLWQKLMRLCGLAPAEDWKRVKHLAVSGTNGVAVGLLMNGTCVVRRVGTSSEKLNAELYRKAQNTVLSWKNIVSVAISDAIFGLDSFGRVYCAPLSWQSSYRETAEWRNIVRLVSGGKGQIFGITSDGHVAVCGGELSKSRKRALESLRDAVDLGICGREEIVVVHRDGTVENLRAGVLYDFLCHGRPGCIACHRGGIAARDANGVIRFIADGEAQLSPLPFGQTRVDSFALGDLNRAEPFLIAVEKESI